MENMIRSIVDRHWGELLDTRYTARLEWVATERADDAAARCLLRVEYSAVSETTSAPMQLHLVVSMSHLSELPGLLDAALANCLQDVNAAPPQAGTAGVRRWIRKRPGRLRVAV